MTKWPEEERKALLIGFGAAALICALVSLLCVLAILTGNWHLRRIARLDVLLASVAFLSISAYLYRLVRSRKLP